MLENDSSDESVVASSDTSAEAEEQEMESEEESTEEDEGETTEGNAGWVDSISKILRTNKTKGKKALVLSKAKKLSDVKKTKTKLTDFEIQTKDGEIKRENILDENETEATKSKEPPRKKVMHFIKRLV